MGESSRGDDDNIPPPSSNDTSGERSKDNDNNLITSTRNEKIGEPHVDNDNVPPDRTTEQVEGDVNNHDRRPIGKETTEDNDRPQASTAQPYHGKQLVEQFDDTDNTSHVTVDNAEASYKDTIREQSANDEKTIQVDHDNSQSKYENKRMVGDNSSPSSQRTNKDNITSSAKTTGEQFDKCENEDSSSPDKKTTEGDNAPPAPNTSLPHNRTQHGNNDSFLETESKITKHEEGNNRNKQLLQDDNESEASNASQLHNKSTREPSVDNDKSMCVLDNAPPSGNTTTQQQNVNDNNNNNISGADLQPDGTNSTQTPRKTLQQQFLDDENNPAFTTPSPRNRKTQSQKHQLRTNTGTKIKRNRPQLQHIHSLDDKIQNVSDSEEEYDYYNYESGAKIVFNNSSYEYCAAAHGQSLPEFVVSDENTPEIFQAPRRAAVHPNRPPFLELRPHPLRETQVGKYLRTIASTDTQLWAGQECGVRVWKLSDAYAPGIGFGGRARRGDEEAALFYESVSTSPTMCLTIDCSSKLVWSGHKDGKIRSWNMDEELNDDPFSEGLSWQAHRGPVLALIISSYGDLWSGSEGGAIHVWPWEAIDKSLSMKLEERHMASLLVERSLINLRSQVTLNGVCNISSQDVKSLLCDKSVAKVWACGTSSISLWDARTKELLKVYNVDGHIENRADTPSVQDQKVEDEMNVKLVSKSKKEKPHGFLQRSRNAIKGAAGAVRRAATTSKSGGEESKLKIEAAVLASNGMIYIGCTNGLIVQWDGNGTRLQEFNHHPCAVLCFCTYGSRIWVGYVSGMVQVLDLDGNLIAGWVAHNGPVIKLVVGNGHFFSLATHGGIRGWSTASPGPIDQIIRPELSKKELSYTRRENVKILVGTWNVGEGKSSHDALMAWVGSAVSDVGIFVVGLQEVEMGAGFLAMSAAKETVGLEKSSIGNWWQDAIGKALDEGSTFERVGSRQLAGLLIAIWVRTSIRTYVGDLDVGAVACGLGRTIGNKGGVGLRLRVYDRIMCFVNCHLAAHLEAVNRRNADFSHIYRTMTFSRSSLLSNASAGVSSVAQGVRGTDTVESNPGKGKPDLAEADLVIFCGDFNYRLFGISYDDARDLVSQRSFDWLRERDQLRAEMKAGKVFQGMREAIIRFPPTYKFDKGKPGLGGYDSGEKKRIPAWCDRILYRDNRSSSTMECNLECPIVASILQYEACMDVLESDHKPVRCKLTVDIANVDRSIRRQETGKIINSHDTISSLRHELCVIPKTDINITHILLQSQETSSFKFTNRSATDKAIFQIICEGQATIQEDEQELVYKPRGAFGFPRWLEVIPASGVVGPDQVADILVRHKDFHTTEKLVEGVPQTWWAEDTCDKEALLKVVVRGNFSSETRSHTVHVHHCYSGKATQTDSSNGSGSRKYQGNTCHQSGVGHVGSQSDNDENNSLHGSEKKLK